MLARPCVSLQIYTCVRDMHVVRVDDIYMMVRCSERACLCCACATSPYLFLHTQSSVVCTGQKAQLALSGDGILKPSVMDSVQPDSHGGLANYMAATAMTGLGGKRSIKEKKDKPPSPGSTAPQQPTTLRERASSYAEKAKTVSSQSRWYCINLADHDVSGDPMHAHVARACVSCIPRRTAARCTLVTLRGQRLSMQQPYIRACLSQ